MFVLTQNHMLDSEDSKGTNFVQINLNGRVCYHSQAEKITVDQNHLKRSVFGVSLSIVTCPPKITSGILLLLSWYFAVMQTIITYLFWHIYFASSFSETHFQNLHTTCASKAYLHKISLNNCRFLLHFIL